MGNVYTCASGVKW